MALENKNLTFIGVNGSERPNGNGAYAYRHLKEVRSEEGVSLEVINVWDLDLDPCGACGDCNFRAVPCEVDDGLAELIPRLASADGIILSAPVHGFGPSPTLPTFIERIGTGHLRFNRVLTNKVGGAFVTGRRYSHVETYNYLIQHLLLNRMIVPGAGFPPVLFGDKTGEVAFDEEGMEMLDRMARRMARLAKILKSHREEVGEDWLAEESFSERDRPKTDGRGDIFDE